MRPMDWDLLTRIIQGESTEKIPAFIIDSPWLPNWAGVKIIDYFSSEETWFSCHQKAIETFPDIWFLPSFWSEFGMCTEPSAFGARCTFPENEFPHAHPVIRQPEDIDKLQKPNPKSDGLLPFMLQRLIRYRKRMEATGTEIHFSISRGPLNIASYLMGTTEFLTLLMMDPERGHRLIRLITDFLLEWHDLQASRIDSIDSLFMLDDLIGFMSRDQFEEFGLPYFTELYSGSKTIRYLHNDAPCRESAPLLKKMGVNLFNMGTDVALNDLRNLCGDGVTLMGNLPPRDVLANGTPAEVFEKARNLFDGIKDEPYILPSCGGGMPPGVSTKNIRAFVKAVRES